jgi:hypothetical protein
LGLRGSGLDGVVWKQGAAHFASFAVAKLDNMVDEKVNQIVEFGNG